jgi:polyisoprenoid-binding protein YceI
MRSRALFPALAAVAGVAALVLSTPAAPKASAAATGYTIDNVHSFVTFRIRHLQVGYVAGRFNVISGTVNVDDANPSASSVNVEVKADSIDTNNTKRNDDLRGPDFLNVAQFPKITFQSTAVAKVDATHWDVTGNLTLHGTTKSVTIRMEQGGPITDPWKKQRVGFDGAITIQRSQYGVSGLMEPGGDDVMLRLSFEAVKG